MFKFTRAAWRSGLDLFYSPSVYSYFPLPPALPAVVTIHDAIAERFPDLTLPARKDRLAWRAKVTLAKAQSKLILTVSPYAAREIATHLHIAPNRIRVTLEGVSEVFRPSRAADIRDAADRAGVPAGRRWVIYVGGFGPHKRVDVLLRAHADVARRQGPRAPLLLLAGPLGAGFHEDTASLRRIIRESGTEAFVRWIGYVPDEDLRHLHSGALALALVSASEGFGLPAVEAARCGAPVIATTESPLPEILAGGGVFVAPGDPAPVARAIERLLDDEAGRREMGEIAREKASLLSWPRAARLALDALEEAGPAAEKVGSNAHART
jgi:glycosyltransferase involved in cell wall biosynthesis